MKKLIRALTFEPSDFKGEKNELPSLTVPDQSFSIAEILEKHMQGIPLGILKQGTFSGTDDFDDIDETRRPDFDLVDAQNLMDTLGQTTEAQIVDHKNDAEPVRKSENEQHNEPQE